MLIEIYLLITFLMGSMFFSGAETAVLGLGPLNLVRGDRKKLYRLYTYKEKIITTCLIGNNITIVGATILVANLILSSGKLWTTILALSLEVILFFILAEALPKMIAQHFNIRILKYLYYPINFFYYLFWPFTRLFLSLTNYLFRFLSRRNQFNREDIFHFLSIHMDRQNITGSLMKLNSTTVKEIMTPLNEVYSLSQDATVKESIALLEKTSYSRYPIYEDRGDNIMGYINISDILKAHKNDKISQWVRNAEYVSEFLSIDKLLFKMQENKISMLFIVSEFGSVIGLVTLEDIAEELVGDIHSEEQPQLEAIKQHRRDKNLFTLSGVLDIDDFNDYFHLNIKKDGFETLGGLLMKKTMNIPQVNQELHFDFGVLKILEGDSKNVRQLQFNRKAPKSW